MLLGLVALIGGFAIYAKLSDAHAIDSEVNSVGDKGAVCSLYESGRSDDPVVQAEYDSDSSFVSALNRKAQSDDCGDTTNISHDCSYLNDNISPDPATEQAEARYFNQYCGGSSTGTP